jgi:hypothetical protein
MNETFKPLEFLKRNKPAAKQANVIINIGKVREKEPEPKEGEEEFITEETENAEKAEKAAQKKEAKKTIKDYRKISNIDSSVIYDRLKDKKPFKVSVLHSLKDLSKETIAPIPIGEPGIKGTKQSVVIREPQNLEMKTIDKPEIVIPERSKIISEDVVEKGNREPEVEAVVEKQREVEIEEIEELKELEEMVEKAHKADKGEKNVAEKPIETKKVVEETKIKKTRKPRLKIVEKDKDKDINPDLTTRAIQEKLPEIPEPKKIEKIAMKVSPYYMNNRKLYVQKMADLLKSYKKDLADDDKNISCESRTADKEFELLTHQKVMLDYLNLYTPYRGLLVYHGLGSGKTCSSIAIAEGMKTNKQIFVLTPASLKMNFFSELKKCGDPIYKQNQKWEYVSIEGNAQTRTMLSKALSLSTDYFNKHKGAWVINMETGTNFADKTPEEQKEIDNQLNEMIRTKYTDINYNGLNAKGLVTLSNNYTRNPFDNSVIIIDEAHNFISRIVNKMKKPKSVSYRLYQYLMSAVNAKVVLLTGTPIINYPNEIGILFNILRGFIKTWTLNINVETNEKITTETILNIFDKENFRSYDYVEYSGNKLTITRNPYGFINVKKRGALKGTERKPKNTGGTLIEVFDRFLNGGKSKKSKNENKENKPNKRTTKKKRITISSYDNIAPKLEYEELDITEDESAEKAYRIGYNGENNPHKGGAGGVGGADNAFEKYNGVKLDDAGNIPDNVFEETLVKILNKNGLKIVGKISITNYKSLPDDKDEFLELFLKEGEVTNLELFQKRILGLTSYFRSAQEQLLPRFEKTQEGDIFHIVKCVMTPHQFSVYEQIRKIEAEEEKRNRNKKNKAAKMPDNDDIYKISSTYRIFSRSACNFAFPNNIRRPIPDKKQLSESDFNAVPLNERKEQNDEEFEEAEEVEAEVEETGEAEGNEGETKTMKEKDVLTYQSRIEKALEELKFNPETPREEEYLRKQDLEMYSPKFVEILNNIQDEQNEGLHLVYSQFRTIEGIGILKLILEANGYAEFKIQKTSNEWEIVDNEADKEKPRFVLYTGTETAEEKEIIRNIYNSSWNAIPSNIATKLQGQYENNFLGEVIKIFMITSSGAEGINLKNTRFVHIVEPYWHMVRIEQVIGRARRICSHQDLPEELRTVKVFLYLSILSEEQKTSEKNIELRIRDVSRIDGETPVTTDESLFETATLKDKNNKLFLKAVKQTSIDCSLYATGNKEEKLVCYGFGKVESNNFSSYPSYEKDAVEKQDLNVRATIIKAKKITYKGKDYALNTNNNEIYTMENYNDHKATGAELVMVGKLVKKGDQFVIEMV